MQAVCHPAVWLIHLASCVTFDNLTISSFSTRYWQNSPGQIRRRTLRAASLLTPLSCRCGRFVCRCDLLTAVFVVMSSLICLGRGAKYCDEYVGLSVGSHILKTIRLIFTEFVAWSSTGDFIMHYVVFVDDVTFSHNGLCGISSVYL